MYVFSTDKISLDNSRKPPSFHSSNSTTSTPLSKHSAKKASPASVPNQLTHRGVRSVPTCFSPSHSFLEILASSADMKGGEG